MRPRGKRVKAPQPAKMLERHVIKQCLDLMEWRGWRPVRITRGVFVAPGAEGNATPRTFSSGEPGQCDHQFVRYIGDDYNIPGLSLTLWVEFKRPGDRRKCTCIPGDNRLCGFCKQARWQDREEKRGAMVWRNIRDFADFAERYDRMFGWVHMGAVKGQMDMLVAAAGGLRV
jgi:hypothetical protein